MPFYPSKPTINPKLEEKAQAEFYGLRSNMERFDPSTLSFEELDTLRRVLLEADRKSQPNSFDLSKPPVVPYQFHKFPKMVYDHKASKPPSDKTVRGPYGEELRHTAAVYVTRTVKNEEELQEALSEGYREDPPTFHKGK